MRKYLVTLSKEFEVEAENKDDAREQSQSQI